MELPDVAHRTPSPDGKHELVVYNCRETSMNRYDAQVALLDEHGDLVEDFAPIWAITQRAGAWSADGRHLAFVAAAGGCSFYLVRESDSGRFAVVRIDNPHPLEFGFEGSRALRIEVDPDQLAAANCQHVFGGARAEFPIRRFKRPAPLLIELASLRFHERPELATIAGYIEAEPSHQLGLEPDGFFPYDGPPLLSTAQEVNGLKLLVLHLEAFAESGDAVAKGWLEEVRSRKGRRLDRWETVAGILGKRSR